MDTSKTCRCEKCGMTPINTMEIDALVKDAELLRKIKYQFQCDRETPLTLQEIRFRIFGDEDDKENEATNNESGVV